MPKKEIQTHRNSSVGGMWQIKQVFTCTKLPDETKVSILLEDNEINFFSGGISMTGSGHIKDTVVRRNIVRNSIQ